jgi:hypothetical protein
VEGDEGQEKGQEKGKEKGQEKEYMHMRMKKCSKLEHQHKKQYYK